MAIEVKHISKSFQDKPVVQALSFKVSKGEIVGFLGPNGAGKSTTMRMISGYLKPSSGEVLIHGENVFSSDASIKKQLGYLPENNPLYPNMYVREYLAFMGSIYGIKGKEIQKAIDQAILKCGLQSMQHKKIEALSKGYRQRVGLAKAILHNPSILILDEPISGLDPNQLIEIRKLLKEESKQKAILLSTHLMQEVIALCDRVLILDKGKLVASNTLEQLQEKGTYELIVQFKESIQEEELKAIGGVTNVEKIAQGKYRLQTSNQDQVREALSKYASENQYTLLELTLRKNSLEELFQQLTQKE